MLRGDEIRAGQVNRAADTVIGWARADAAAGVSRDRILFSFESNFEEISDAIALLPGQGEEEAYRDLYAKLYEFAKETMEDSYMPLYLFILYRYANALLMAGESGSAVEHFEKLLAGTDRLIGIENSYGIHCLERLARAAAADGQRQKTLDALQRMKQISAEQFGKESAMAMAVKRFSERVILEL